MIIDDEPKAIELLKDSLAYLYDNLIVSGVYISWKEALDALRNNPPDILFSDISMPGKNSMELLKLVPELDSEIIFITAHSDYALSAFQFSAAGYILKPIDDTELKNAVDKAIERVSNKKLANYNVKNLLVLNSKIGIPNNAGIDYIDINNIIYLESVNKCTKLVTKDGEILSSYNIGKFKSILDNPLFFQIHRSFIVNLNCIRRYETSGTVIMIDKREIPVSKNEKEQFLQLFGRITKTSGV